MRNNVEWYKNSNSNIHSSDVENNIKQTNEIHDRKMFEETKCRIISPRPNTNFEIPDAYRSKKN